MKHVKKISNVPASAYYDANIYQKPNGAIVFHDDQGKVKIHPDVVN